MTPPQVRTLWATLVPTMLWATWLIGYDIWTYRRHGNASTISYVMWMMAREWPIFTWLSGFVVGVLVGHIAWPQDKGKVASIEPTEADDAAP